MARLKEHKELLGILVLSWLLRLKLCLGGGALYWPDSNRFSQAFRVVNLAFHGHFLQAFDTVLVIPMHVGFVITGIPIAALHSVAVILMRLPSRWPSFQDTMWITGAMLSLASVANIALAYALALKLKASRREALIAAVLMAASNTMFYYARFNLPYDFALGFCLLGFCVGLAEKPTLKQSLLCGALLGWGFMVHYAHWTIVGVLSLAHILYGRPPVKEMLRRTAALAVSGPSWLVLMTVLSVFRPMPLYIVTVKSFFDHGVHDVIYGVYSEGWRLTWAYFWSAEHTFLILWLNGCAYGLARWKKEGFNRGALWALIALGLYAVITIGSNTLHVSCAYGRLARQMTPFLCLATAYLVENVADSRSPAQWAAAAAFLILQAGFNFATPWMQRFPSEIKKEVAVKYGTFNEAVTINMGPDPIPEVDDGTKPYILVNARDLFPVLAAMPAPKGEVLARWEHPLKYKPYQYEGYKPAEREILDDTDIAIRLLKR